MIPIGYILDADEYQRTKFDIETAKHDLEKVQADLLAKQDELTSRDLTIAQHAATIQSLTAQRDNILMEKDAALTQVKIANGEISTLTTRIQSLQTEVQRPTIARKPTITKTTMKDVAGVAIPKDNAPSATQDQNARDMMLIASLMGLNAWRGFFNLQEIVKHAAMADTSTSHLPGYGRRLGLTFIADTMNNHAVNLNDSDLKIALDGLRKMAGSGPFVGVFDDANQYRDTKNTDGTLKYPAGTLEQLIGRIRQFAPDMILIASLTANAVIGEYKPLFDFVEAQTFGTIRELPVFLGRSFDVHCLDGRKEISVDYLTQAIEIVSTKNPRNLFWYTTAITDWKNMTAQLPLIRTLVQRWMSMAR